MKIVHINFSDIQGGASIAAYRHNCCMNITKFGESSMLVIDKQRKDDTIFNFVDNMKKKMQKILYMKMSDFLLSLCQPQTFFSYLRYGLDLSQSSQVKRADVIIIHWVNSQTTSIDGIEKIFRLGKPTYLFLHDQWYMTGGCHCAQGCKEYFATCEKCQKVRTFMGFNIARKQFRKKILWCKYPNLAILAPSEWMCSCAKKSLILGNLPVYLCRNVIDTNIFRPFNKQLCRMRMGISTEKKIIAFAGVSLTAPWKGFRYLLDCLSLLPKDSYQCLVAGTYDAVLDAASPINIKFTGYIADEHTLVQFYNSASVLVIPSLQDNFPNTVMEALACGTPCVGFNIGGIPELIKHKVNGYISMDISSEGLAEGVRWCLDESNYSSISNCARNDVVDNYSYEKAKSIYTNIKVEL